MWNISKQPISPDDDTSVQDRNDGSVFDLGEGSSRKRACVDLSPDDVECSSELIEVGFDTEINNPEYFDLTDIYT